MFTRVGAVAFKKDLDNTLALCERLGNPQHKFKSIHVAGTNGKGSTSHMLAAILQKAGYKTGLYTSPHLKHFGERIRINGEMISEDFVINFVAEQKEAFETISPSFFEATVAMAFAYFAAEKVDIAIIEVGLGGRIDSTNIITPELSVITNISFDHMNMLGNTLPEIASEKAGIIKQGIPVVVGEKQAETEQVFIDKAASTHSTIHFADQDLYLENVVRNAQYFHADIFRGDTLLYQDLQMDLNGNYQRKNVLTVIRAVLCLHELGYKISKEALYDALKAVKTITGLQGRWQAIGENPLIICDTGHNIAGITEVMQNIRETPHDQLHIVIGMVKDKDISAVLNILPKDARYYFCNPDIERALPAAELAEQAKNYHLNGDVFPSITLAIHAAKDDADANDMIFIGGSTFVVAEAL